MSKLLTPLALVAALLFVGCDGASLEPEMPATSVLKVEKYNASSSKSMALDYAIDWVYALQGTDEEGNYAIPARRSDPDSMLGAPDGAMFSLGFDDPNTATQEGEVILDFTTGQLLKALTVVVTETTFDDLSSPYPLEAAKVYVGPNESGPWTEVGTATNVGARPAPESELLLNGETCFRYVRLVDVTDPAPYADRVGLANGFDVDAVGVESNGTCATGNCIETKNLIAGQHNDVGSVIIERLSDTQIKVTFKLDVPGSIQDTYVHVGGSLADFPLNKPGQPKSGQFDYKTEGHAANTTEFSYVINVPAGTNPLYVGAHANVSYQLNGRWKSDTAWGEGPRFTNKNWFMYMLFECD